MAQTNLVLKQSTESTEKVTWDIIDKLYHLVVSSNGAEPAVAAASEDIQGNISSDHGFEDAVLYLRNRFPNLLITVVDNNYYIRFADSNVETLLTDTIGLGDGNGITISEASTAMFADLFKSNTDIKDFDEFKYFTSQNQANSFSFEGCTKLRSIDLTNLTVPPPANAFKDCSALTHYHGVNGTAGVLNLSKLNSGRIGNYAFSGNTGLTEIVSLGNCTQIGQYSFQNCTNLTTINQSVLNNITWLGSNCFTGCGLVLEDLSLPNVTHISGWGPFENCTGLQNSLKTVSNLGNIDDTGMGNFKNCKLLTSVVLPETCTTIAQSSFGYCTSLVSINTDNIQTFSLQCLVGCTSLETININNASTIATSSFMGCTNLKYYHGEYDENDNTTRPEGVLDLSLCTNFNSDTLNGVFKSCKSLKEVRSLKNVTKLGLGWGEGTFSECSNLEYINETDFQNLISLDSSFRNCSKLQNLINLNLPNLTYLGNDVFKGCTQIETVENLGNITSIGNNCFNGCASLISINFPSTLTSIGYGCFNGCSNLQGIFNIPEGVTSIGQQIVFNCSSLSEIILPSTLQTIGNWAFQGCSSLTSVTCKATTPPTATDVFNSTNNCPIYVPSESVEAYKAAGGWSTYADRIQAIPEE